MAKLTAKQQRFVDEYLIDLNATQAAIRAGYSPTSARQIADDNMSKHDISDAVAKAMAERSKRTGINQDRVLTELAKIAFVNPANVINFSDGSVKESASQDDLACIQSIKIKTSYSETGETVEKEVKMYDKKSALDSIGKHLGMFSEKLKIEGAIPVVISDDLDADDGD